MMMNFTASTSVKRFGQRLARLKFSRPCRRRRTDRGTLGITHVYERAQIITLKVEKLTPSQNQTSSLEDAR